MKQKVLIFVESDGLRPPPDTVAEALLIAHSLPEDLSDDELWDDFDCLGLDGLTDREIEDAVSLLQRLGWDFRYEVVH